MSIRVFSHAHVILPPSLSSLALSFSCQVRLARARLECSDFDAAKLGVGAFFVSVDARDVLLPDGTAVENGTLFRNAFHLSDYAQCDVFVPCGGRPEAVSASNVQQAFRDGRCLYGSVVEGANLFFSEAARLQLERAGVVLFKDASANKGGAATHISRRNHEIDGAGNILHTTSSTDSLIFSTIMNCSF